MKSRVPNFEIFPDIILGYMNCDIVVECHIALLKEIQKDAASDKNMMSLN